MRKDDLEVLKESVSHSFKSLLKKNFKLTGEEKNERKN